jgi:hypothetical protein
MNGRRPPWRNRIHALGAWLSASVSRLTIWRPRQPRREPAQWRQAVRRGLTFLMVPLFAASAALRHAGQALVHWWSERNGRLLVRGGPFLFVAVGCTYLAVAHQIRPADTLRRDYELAGRAALDRKDYALASICFERLSELDGERPSTVFQLAVAAEGQGDLPRMRLLLERLSPADKAVHAGAHFWKAGQVLADPALTAERLRRRPWRRGSCFGRTARKRPKDICGPLWMIFPTCNFSWRGSAWCRGDATSPVSGRRRPMPISPNNSRRTRRITRPV